MQLGLALSGGGFRATLFHLGIVKALLDRGVLEDVRHITSVSGGSILAAHLVLHWDEYTDPSTFAEPAREIIEFARKDVRGRVFRRLLLPPYLLLPYLGNLRQRRRLRRDGTVRNLLFERDLHALFGEMLLRDLPAKAPKVRLDILTTNLTQGSLAYFSNGEFVASDEPSADRIETPITVARAVMTSALFPGFFPTVEFNAENLVVEPGKFSRTQYFTDGGVYDNLGIRRFQTVLAQDENALEQVLVSDASGAFDWLIESETLGYWKTALRSSEVFMKRLADLECELAGGDSEQFKFLRISDVAENGVLPETVQEQIKHIRTDLDRFSVSEIRAVVMHGYEVAARATEGWTDVPASKMVPWDPFPEVPREPEMRWVDQLRRARFHPSGLFNRRDWPSYVYPALLILALVLLVNWYQGQRVHWHYGDQVRVNGEIVDRVDEPEQTKAIVAGALRKPHRNQENRLEAAFLAYALQLQQQDDASKKMLEKAKANLDPAHLSRFHQAKWRHFYSTLPMTSFGFPDCPDPERALAFAEDAVAGVPARSSYQLEVALMSYGIAAKPEQTAELKKRSLELLDRAKRKLDAGRLARFHETKWKHFYSTLRTTSFGFRELPDLDVALQYAKDAIDGLPHQSPLHVETALTSYGVYSKPYQEKMQVDPQKFAARKAEARKAFEQALQYLDSIDTNELSPINRFRATLMKGHLFLTNGGDEFTAAGDLMNKGKRAEAAGKAQEAEIQYANAWNTYELARDLYFTDLWKVHINLCNAASARARAAARYIASKEPLDESTRQQLRTVIRANRLAAQRSCMDALDVAVSGVWQPSFVLAGVALDQNNPVEASKRFLDGYAIARRNDEGELFLDYLRGRKEVEPLCQFTEFSRTFIEACR